MTDLMRKNGKPESLQNSVIDASGRPAFSGSSPEVRRHRSCCTRCRRPEPTCYCHLIRSFASVPRFVILMHPQETKRAIASGRMAHLCLTNSMLLTGVDFTSDSRVNALIENPSLQPLLLFPGPSAVNLTVIRSIQIGAASGDKEALAWDRLFPPGREPVVFVPDGTWRTARRIRRLSQNLSRLPQICFTPPRPSGFAVRKQPGPHCYSTLEAIHHLIDLWPKAKKESERPSSAPDAHHNLLEVFRFMVRQQQEFEWEHRSA